MASRNTSSNASHFWLRYEQLTTKDLPVILETGISHSTLSSWKNRHTFPRANEALKIADALHTTVEYLVTGTEKSIASYPPAVLEIAAAAGQLSEESLAILKGIIAGLPHTQKLRSSV